MAQVKGLVGVRRAIFYHHKLAFRSFVFEAVVLVTTDVVEQLSPERGLDCDVEEALYHIELLYCLAVRGKIFTNLLCCGVGSLV